MPKHSSMAKIASTLPSESSPRSSIRASGAISTGYSRSCFARIAITAASISARST
ncbi:MAG: hypothetical protein WAT35_17335 [Tabrizicola sp.]|uniref:hypothetical protein n=1 Tax=Tabrizicola sp. TaxID=2005166 RepID=UPI003BAE2A7E